MGPQVNPTGGASPRFLPITAEEVLALGWERPDIILVTGDTYIDSPFIGAAVIGRLLLSAGYRVALIPQPDVTGCADIARLGEPALFWGVTAGSVDSMVANYTAAGKRRRRDDLTPGGINNCRPDRAVIVYSNLIRRCFKQTRPIVLGGIEASLRRISHYDAWDNAVRRSILFDAKADILVYGMAEQAILELAACLRDGRKADTIRGICTIGREAPRPCDAFPGTPIELPPFEQAAADPHAFARMFKQFYAHSDPRTAGRLYQRQDTRYLVQNPPALPPAPGELDRIYEMPFAREAHPACAAMGHTPALETIRFALTTHRGCYGECRFCAISVHQGREVVSRTRASLLREAAAYVSHPEFKGIIADVGGPTANMYAMECARKNTRGPCAGKSCLFPDVCRRLPVDHGPQIRLLRDLRALAGVRKVFIGSGIRYDLILADRRNGSRYLREILCHHVSGQLKIAPEHCVDHVLRLMGKPGRERLESFLELFEQVQRDCGAKAYLTYYLMAAHPGCTLSDMAQLQKFARHRLHLRPEQVQIFTPTPSTFSTLMYHLEKEFDTDRSIFVEKNTHRKQAQKEAICGAQKSGRSKRDLISSKRCAS